MHTIDLNCDLGEGGGFDDHLMPYISSCNIACGGHFGTDKTIAQTVMLALENKVKIGAHPSYPDKEGFGRQPMNIPLKDFRKSLKTQIRTIKCILEEKGGQLHHVKPHGALYNEIVHDKKKANAVIDTILEIDDSLILFVPPKSIVEKLAEGKLKTWKEGFADRNYNPDFSLVSRQKPNAVLTEKEQVFRRVFSVVSKGEITAINGAKLPAEFDTICLHSDTQNSVEILKYLSTELNKENIKIK